MDLDPAGVACLRFGFVLPDDLLLGRHFDDRRVPGVQEQVAVIELRNVVRIVVARDFPLDLPVFSDDGDVPLILSQHAIGRLGGGCHGRNKQESSQNQVPHSRILKKS